jgi:nitronate monooxygenase
LGATPSDATSTFHDEVLGLSQVAERLALLNSGMAWIIGQFDATLPRVTDDERHALLAEWREIHRGDLKDCTALLDWLAKQT